MTKSPDELMNDFLETTFFQIQPPEGEVVTAAASRFVWHVTFVKNAAKIKSQGLKVLQDSLWVNNTGNRMNSQGGVFAFNHAEDALRWAIKQEFDFKKPVAIIKLKHGKTWEVDPNMGLFTTKGKALQSLVPVPASDVLKIIPIGDWERAGPMGMTWDKWAAMRTKELERG